MKKRSLGVLRCCAVSAILFSLLWGVFQPVSAGPVERPDQGRIVVDVPDITEYYHQDFSIRYNPDDMKYSREMLFVPHCVEGHLDLWMGHPKMSNGFLFDIDRGDYSLVVETGEKGDVSGTFSLHGKSTGRLADHTWNTVDGNPSLNGFEELHEIWVEGEVESGKGVYNSDGFLRVASNEEYCNGSCGTMQVTYTYSAINTSGNTPQVEQNTITYEIGMEYFAMYTNFKGVSGFDITNRWTERTKDLCYHNAEIFKVNLENDPNNEQDFWYGDLDFDDKGNEKQIPAFSEPGSYDPPDQGQADQPQLEEAPSLSDSPNARFSISAGCDDSIASGQDIDCRVNIQRDNDEVGMLTVLWEMDGYAAGQDNVLGNSATFNFPNLPPGTHTVQVTVLDGATGDVRVAAMNVEVDGFASPDDAPNRIPAGAQTASAVGTTALIGAWLWAEWLAAKGSALAEERRDAQEARDRQAWYEDQMQRNDEVKARQQARQRAEGANQNALEAEWKRYRNKLLETVKKHENSEYLVDLLDDLQEVVYRDGKWDADGLQRLERMINSRLVLDREDEVRAEWKRMWDANQRREAEVNSILRSHKMAAAEVTVDLLTQGASNLIIMPTKALVSAIYARRRAMMLGKTGTEAAWSVMKDAGLSLGLDYLSGKGHRQNSPSVIGKAAQKYLEKRLNVGAEKTIADFRDDPEMPVHLWQGAGAKLVEVPKPAANLPVVKSSWGNGAQTNLAGPVYRPPESNVLMRVGMENGLERISQLDSGLADDVRRIIEEGSQVNPHINNVLSPGNPSYPLTPQDEVARSLMNNPSYKQAVQDGLVPNRVQQVVNQTRDKIAKNATVEAFQALDKVDLNGQSASSYIKNVTVSGTGARPLNPQAVGRYTDWDATVIARDGDVVGSAGRQAEELFKSHFDDALRQAGVNADTAEVSMFTGVPASPDAPIPEGYSSEGLTHWHKADMTSHGQSAVRLEDGGVMFNAHPDAAPMQERLMKDLGQMEAAPRFSAISEDIAADVRQLIHCHVDARVNETGGPLDPLTVLRLEGKHAVRVWKAQNAGSGSQMPDWMDKVMRLKNDPNYHLSGGELDDVWKNYIEYLDLPSDLGGGR